MRAERTVGCIFIANFAAAMAIAQGHPAVATAPKVNTPPTGSAHKSNGRAGLLCAKPTAWNSLQIPVMRSAAEYGWSWVNESGKPAERMAPAMQRDMTELNKSVQAAAGKYSDAAIQKDMKTYMDGVNQLAGCQASSQNPEQLAQLPVLSIRRLTHTVDVIHSLHQQARNPVHVQGMAQFRQAELTAAKSAAPVETTSENISSKIEAAVSNDSQSRADGILNRLIEAGTKAASDTASNNRNTPQPSAIPNPAAGNRAPAAASPSAGASVLRNTAQTYQRTGLTHPAGGTAIKTYQPPSSHNYTAMSQWLRSSDQSLSPLQAAADAELAMRSGNGDATRFAFADASEEAEVRPDSLLEALQTSTLLDIPVDAEGRSLRWEDLTRYTDYRDIRYTSAPVHCESCDALPGRGAGGGGK